MKPTIIEEVRARKVLDSRGNWTIEVDVETCGYGFGRAAAPSGASTGRHEVVAFPDGGVDKAILEVDEVIAPELEGRDAEEQDVIDAVLKDIDGTDNFSNIGGNTAVAISLANAKAAAHSLNLPLYKFLGGSFSTELPYPLGNVIGGGAHAANATDIQEFLVIPVGAENIAEAVYLNSLVHKKVKEALSRGGANLGKGDEGAWAPNIGDTEALDTLREVCEEVKAETGREVRMGLDVAASELWDPKKKLYRYRREGRDRDTGDQIEYIKELIETYNLFYVEDPLQEEDFEAFFQLTSNVDDCLVCGDDLYVTSVERIERGIREGSTNAVLIKPNQCGTLTDTFNAINLAKKHKLTNVISHRSGETSDESIAHLGVAFCCPIIKTGAVGGERTAKLNELIRISEELTPHRAEMAKLP
ncbi:MAG: phosphopyruvate hydratase [Euryarchaeota archaeon]|nr:phosphopyruvate hydratase [Euryarchaeota archaeon]